MKQYIDKAVAIKVVENRIEELQKLFEKNERKLDSVKKTSILFCMSECIVILSRIDALNVRKVDLKQEIKNRIDNLSNLYCYMEDLFNGKEEEGVYPIPEKVTNELIEFAEYFYELGLKAQKGE